MSSNAVFQGPFRLPPHVGKALDRSRFLDGTFKTYWGPHRQSNSATTYTFPETWAEAGTVARIPRVIRILGNSSVPTNIYAQAGNLVDAFVLAGSYQNLWTNKAEAVGLEFQANGNTLILAAPIAADLAANNYFPTDSLSNFCVTELLPVTRYTTSGGGVIVNINMANVTTDANAIQQAGEQAPRFHVRVYFHSVFPAAPAGTLAGNSRIATRQIYEVEFPNLIDPDFYSFAGQFVAADFPTNVANDIIGYATTHYSL